MIEIVGGRGTGKTTKLFAEVQELANSLNSYSSILVVSSSIEMFDYYQIPRRCRCSIENFARDTRGWEDYKYIFFDDIDYFFSILSRERNIYIRNAVLKDLFEKLYGYCLSSPYSEQTLEDIMEATYFPHTNILKGFLMTERLTMTSFKYFDEKTFKEIWTTRHWPRGRLSGFEVYECFPYLENSVSISI